MLELVTIYYRFVLLELIIMYGVNLLAKLLTEKNIFIEISSGNNYTGAELINIIKNNLIYWHIGRF